MEEDNSPWAYLPNPALFKIFQHLNYKELVNVGEVCRIWFDASRDELLWKRLFYINFLVDEPVPLISGKSWYEEFKRLCYNIPLIQTEILEEHVHQVLHCTFSHNGKYFSTCSKDGYVLIWNSTYPVSLKYSKDMKNFSWKYTQFSQFNPTDTLLLVSGTYFGTPHSTSGEIAVFSIRGGLQLQCRIVNKPYDVFGTWYNEQHLLSGDLHWLAHLVSTSFLWLNKASQEAESEHVPITHNMFRFYNRNASSIRAIMLANCLPNSAHHCCNSNNDETELPLKELSLRDIPSSSNNHSVSYMINKTDNGPDLSNSIFYNSDYRKAESELNKICNDSDLDDEDETNNNSLSDEELVTECDKYLIFLTGFKTYTPHQIGFKRIKPFTFPKKLDPGPSLKERLLLHERRKELLKSGPPVPEPNWLDYDSVADKFDRIDHLIDLHGHIVGMGLSPDHRYLYVNSRAWPVGYEVQNPLEPPPIAQEIDIHVIDLVTLKQVGTMLRAHKAYTPNNECFFIFLDVSDEYVASGAEDRHGYLWDRHYGICLAKFPHTDVVNSVAFNPKDSEMLVTTSDDNTIKVWRSRSKVQELGLNESVCQKGIQLWTRRRSSFWNPNCKPVRI